MQTLAIDKERCRRDPLHFAKKLSGFKARPSQARVINERQQWNVLCAGRRWGKDTLIINARVIPRMWTEKNLRVGVYAPGWDEADVFMEIYREWIDNAIAPLRDSIRRDNKFDVKLSNGSRLLCRVASKLSTGKRGRGFDLLYFTESAFIPDVYIATCRATGVGRGLKSEEWHSSQPNGMNHFYRTWNSSYYKSWQFASSDNPMVTPRELEKERSLCTDLEFRSLWLAEFLDDQASVFHQSLIDKAINNDLALYDAIDPPAAQYYAGVDLGRKRDKSTVYVLKYQYPHVEIAYYKEFRIDKDDPIFWDKVLNHLQYLCARFRIIRMKVDMTGIGDKPVMDLKRDVAAKNIPTSIEGINFSYAVKNKWEGLINQLLLKFERFQIHFPFIKPLSVQLKTIRFDTKSRIFHSVGQSPDHVMALALAVSACPNITSIDYSCANRPEYHTTTGFNAEVDELAAKIKSGYALKASEMGPDPEG